MYADLNCALSISTLLLLSLYIKPALPLSGAKPELSYFFRFDKAPESFWVFGLFWANDIMNIVVISLSGCSLSLCFQFLISLSVFWLLF